MNLELYEDSKREGKREVVTRFSPYCDLVRYESSVTPGVWVSMLVKKPAQKGYALFGTHGWHMTLADYEPRFEPYEGLNYLNVQVDMRGRAYSQGKQDCNALELWDVYDAVAYVRAHYGDYLIDPQLVYFEAGSGGGGNAMALAGKFPDLFAAVSALYGMSDYAMWYRGDKIGEFRDEFDVWVGVSPDEDQQAYDARSGICLVDNLYAPIFLAHGETDERVPVAHSRNYVRAAQAAGKGALVSYYEMQGVGTRAHTGNATQQQLETLARMSEENRSAHKTPIVLPKTGELEVGGYVCTRDFTLMLHDMGKTARIAYDLDKREIRFVRKPACGYTLTFK